MTQAGLLRDHSGGRPEDSSPELRTGAIPCRTRAVPRIREGAPATLLRKPSEFAPLTSGAPEATERPRGGSTRRQTPVGALGGPGLSVCAGTQHADTASVANGPGAGHLGPPGAGQIQPPPRASPRERRTWCAS